MQQLPQLRDVSSDQQSKGAAVNLTIDRDAAGAFRHRAGRHRRGDLRPDRPARGGAVLHPAEQLPRGGGGAARRCRRRPELFNSVYMLSPLTGKTVPLSLFVKVDPNATQQPDDQPPGRVSGRDAVVQPGARRRARPGDEAGRAGARQAGRAGDPDRLVPGHGAGLPAVAGRRADPDPGGAAGGLRDPGRALRELHPPADHPLDPAVGRGGRAAGADGRRPGPQRDRHHRASSC